MQRKAKGSKAGPVGRRERRPLSAEFKADAVRRMQTIAGGCVSITLNPNAAKSCGKIAHLCDHVRGY